MFDLRPIPIFEKFVKSLPPHLVFLMDVNGTMNTWKKTLKTTLIPWCFHLIWSRSVLKWVKRWTICNLLLTRNWRCPSNLPFKWWGFLSQVFLRDFTSLGTFFLTEEQPDAHSKKIKFQRFLVSKPFFFGVFVNPFKFRNFQVFFLNYFFSNFSRLYV